MTVVTLFLSWFFNYVPDWFGAALLFFGVELVLVGAVKGSLSERLDFWDDLNYWGRFGVIGGFAVGTLLCWSAVLRELGLIWGYTVLLFALGKVAEGAAAVRFYRKIESLLRRGEWPGGSKLLYRLAVVFIVVLGIYAVVEIRRSGPFFNSTWYEIKAVWTLVIWALASLGIWWKVRDLQGTVPKEIMTGFVLCVGGAEVFNYQSLSGDVVALLAGSVAFSIGFWLAVALWMQSERDQPTVFDWITSI